MSVTRRIDFVRSESDALIARNRCRCRERNCRLKLGPLDRTLFDDGVFRYTCPRCGTTRGDVDVVVDLGFLLLLDSGDDTGEAMVESG